MFIHAILYQVLKIGLTFDFCHVHGNTPYSKFLLIIYVMEGVKTLEAIFNNLGPMQSNPVAFVAS